MRHGPTRRRRSRARASGSRSAATAAPGSAEHPRATSFEWPVWNGVELAFLGRIGLAGLPPCELPAHGALLVFFALDRAPAGTRPTDAGACRVIRVEGDPTPDEPLYGGMPFAAVAPSGELTLPATPTSLLLDAYELDEWTDLRERLAAAQGVEIEDRAAEYHSLHRLLGHPDTYAAGMELDAELVARGVDLDDEPYAYALHEEQAAGADDWILLLQVSNDDRLALDLGEANRLFVWIRRDDLAAGRFEHARAFVR